jgi:O-antigen/teichoic acid export membrane protein
MNFKDLLSSNQIFAILAKAIEGIKVIGINALVARFYGPELFGQFTFVISIVSIIAVIAEFRLQSLLIKEYSKKDIELRILLGSSLVINIFFAFIGFALVFIYSTYENNPIVATGLLIYALSFFYKVPRLFRGFFISIEKNVLIAKCEVLSSCLTAVLIFIVVFNHYSIEYVLLTRSLDFLFISLFFIFYFYKSQDMLGKIEIKLDVIKHLVFKSAPLVLSGAAMILFQRIDIILVREYLGDYEAGLYGSAANIMVLFSLVPLVLSESLAPKMFKGMDSENYQEIRVKFSFIIISVGILLSLSMSVFSYPFIYLIYGEDYLVAFNTFLLLSVSPLLIALGSVAGQLIVADNTQNWSYIKSIIGCVATVFSNVLLIPLIGIEGAAISTVIGLFIANFAAHYFIPVYRKIFYIQCQSFKALPRHLYSMLSFR